MKQKDVSDDSTTTVSDQISQLSSQLDQRFEAMDEKFESRFQAMDEKFESRFQAMDEKFESRFQAMDEKFESRFDKMMTAMSQFAEDTDKRFRKIEARQDIFDEKIDRLIGTIDNFIGRINDQEVENAARESQFQRLLVWARKVSEKTGIPLENL